MENLKFVGEGQFITILSQLNLDKTLFIQFTVFAVVFTLAKILFFNRFSDVQAKRMEGTVLAKSKRDESLTELESLKSKYYSSKKEFQSKLNDQVREHSVANHKEMESNISKIKKNIQIELDAFKKKSDEETKNLLDDSVTSVVELKDKIVAKILN